MTEDLLIMKLKATASEIEYEDDLIGQRMTWLVMGQSFLFGAFAPLIGRVNANMATHMVNLMRMQILLVGLLMPISVLFAVSAAIYSIWHWRSEHDHLCELLGAKGLDWPHVGHTTWVMIIG